MFSTVYQTWLGAAANGNLVICVRDCNNVAGTSTSHCFLVGRIIGGLCDSGATIHVIASHGHYDPSILFRLHRLLRTVRPAVVQTWNPMMDILGGACASLMGIPWILSENSSAPSYPPTWKNRLRQRIGSCSTAIASVSTVGLEYWRPLTSAELYFTPIVPHFVEIEAAAADSALTEVARHQKVILFAGRFVPEKNVERLVRGSDSGCR